MTRSSKFPTGLLAGLISVFLLAIVAPLPARAQRYIYSDPPDSLHPHVQYADSSISLNDRCAVRMTKLSRSMRPIYVNGQPIGFC